MPSITKDRLKELEAAEQVVVHYKQENRSLSNELKRAYRRLESQALTNIQIQKYNEHLLKTIVGFTSLMVTPAFVVKESVEIPDCLKPRDTFQYLFERETNGPDNSPQELS